MSEKQKNRHDEDLLCMAFTEHCHIYFPQTPGQLVWTHIPNEGGSAKQGNKLKKMGVHAGWFDYIFDAYNSERMILIRLEAKVHGRDYGQSQKKFDHLTTGMPMHKAKFYSVEQGHNLLVRFGLSPLKPCKHFKEPNYLTFQEKNKLVFDMYSRRPEDA